MPQAVKDRGLFFGGGEGEVAAMQGCGLTLEGGEVAIIADEVVGGAAPAVAVDLCLHDRCHLSGVSPVALLDTGALQLFRYVDHQHTVDKVAPIGFQQQGNDGDTIRCAECGDAPPHLGVNARMQDAFERGAALGNVEYQSAETAAGEGAVWSQHLVAETRGDVVQSVAAGRHEVARYYVGIDNRHAELFEIMGHGGFAAADAAGEADDEHAASVRSAPRFRKRT